VIHRLRLCINLRLRSAVVSVVLTPMLEGNPPPGLILSTCPAGWFPQGRFSVSLSRDRNRASPASQDNHRLVLLSHRRLIHHASSQLARTMIVTVFVVPQGHSGCIACRQHQDLLF
jgi:hypothetical protein